LYLSEKCQNSLRKKYEIEYKLAVSNNENSDEVKNLEDDLDNIDYSSCDYYDELKEKLS
jgi:hypothetical protein